MATLDLPPTTLPTPHPTVSYWQAPPSSLADFRSTPSLPSTVTTLIVGSGITGASIAYKLLKRDAAADIPMLEARQACSGATGRNGGHCRAGRYLAFDDDCASLGGHEAIKLARFEERGVRDVHELVKSEQIACDFRELESVDLFWGPGVFERAVGSVRAREQALRRETRGGFPSWSVHAAAAARERFGASNAAGAISYPGATLSAYKLVCGLLRLAIRQGLKLQTNTPVLKIGPVPEAAGIREQKWIVQTDRGPVVAERVILATNAYTGHLYHPLQHVIVPTRGQIAAERPGTAFAASRIPSRSYALYHADGTQDYLLCRPPGTSGEGELIYGGGRRKAAGMEVGVQDDSTIHPTGSEYLARAAVVAFGLENWGMDDPEGRVVDEWTGIMGFTIDGKPLVGEAEGTRGLDMRGV